MHYGTAEYERFLRSRMPYYKRKGSPESTHINNTTTMKAISGGNFSIVKTRREVVDNYSNIMEKVSWFNMKALIFGIITVVATIFLLFFNAVWAFPIALLAGIQTIHNYWVAAANYTDFSNFENVPILFPLRNAHKCSK